MSRFTAHRRLVGRPALVAAVLAVVTAVAGCATSAPRRAAGGSTVLNVVAAENFWGSLAAQLGGDRVHVTSIINNPDADPHDYEPTASDGRDIASADLVIVNGVGYDPWASKLADTNASDGQAVLD